MDDLWIMAANIEVIAVTKKSYLYHTILPYGLDTDSIRCLPRVEQ